MRLVHLPSGIVLFPFEMRVAFDDVEAPSKSVSLCPFSMLHRHATAERSASYLVEKYFEVFFCGRTLDFPRDV